MARKGIFTWRDIFLLCDQQMAVFMRGFAHEWYSKVGDFSRVKDLEAALKKVEEPHVEEIEWAVAEWERLEVWPDVSANTAFLIRHRFEMAASFAFRHYQPRSGATIIEVPSMPIEKVLVWLITEWWDSHGRKEYAKTCFVTSRSKKK